MATTTATITLSSGDLTGDALALSVIVSIRLPNVYPQVKL